MKKVRFESPVKSSDYFKMESNECHSPRPFIGVKLGSIHSDLCYTYPIVEKPYNDAVTHYEHSNSSPYPIVNKSKIQNITQVSPKCVPSSELELSMFDATTYKTKISRNSATVTKPEQPLRTNNLFEKQERSNEYSSFKTQGLNSIENFKNVSPNILNTGSGFFIRPGNSMEKNDIFKHISRNLGRKLNLSPERNPFEQKAEIMKKNISTNSLPTKFNENIEKLCRCHHCSERYKENTAPQIRHNSQIINKKDRELLNSCLQDVTECSGKCPCTVPIMPMYVYKQQCNCDIVRKTCHANEICYCTISNCESLTKPQSAVDRKTLAIEQLEKNKRNVCTDIEKPTEVAKMQGEPTVADLYKIIKLQNDQLQLIQDKVDKITSSHSTVTNTIQEGPLKNYRTEQVSLVPPKNHKISIGVMTSFEMVRTSTFINKGFSEPQHVQVQCNTSQLNIKEKSGKPVIQNNVLEGIKPMNNIYGKSLNNDELIDDVCDQQQSNECDEDKVVNDASLHNIQFDNAASPQLSPDQSIYLDIRDYSDFEDDNTNVGWTYYNKVMTHVNGMLQESDMPSSASALYRNTGRCLQMQIDKSNVSITKRVTFGDNPLVVQQPQVNMTPSSDTSMKMNQLAAKYLKNVPTQITHQPIHIPCPSTNVDMSFATRNYMERHQLLQGISRNPQVEMPRFLDITALKQQPKLL